METLLFGNYVFNAVGPNVTCRSGLKWAEKVKVGDWVILEPTDPDPSLGYKWTAEIVEVHTYKTFGRANLHVLLPYEHDPECRNIIGLVSEMAAIYGDDVVEKPLTVLVFVLKGKLMDPVA